MPIPLLLTAFLLVLATSNDAIANRFVKQNLINVPTLSQLNTSDLCSVAKSTLTYKDEENPNQAWQSSIKLPDNVSIERVEETLEFICQLVNSGKGELLKDPQYLNSQFDAFHWRPDKDTANQLANKSTNSRKSQMLRAIPDDKIFLTKYYTKLLKGSKVKSSEYNVALYQLPYDELGLSPEEAQQKQEELTRFKYTRQDVIAGALEHKKLAKPLIWLTEESLHDVLLQGTGVLNVDGTLRYFNVHRNNGIAYDYTIGKTEQARYWYFAEVNGIKGYGNTIDRKIDLLPRVSFAGNVDQLGLGKLFLVSFEKGDFQQAQLGILADEGGAFDNNLFQLDWLVESYYGWADYHAENKHFPDYADVWLLVKKQP